MSRYFKALSKPLLVYVIIVLLGILAHYVKIDWLEELYGALDVGAAVALAVFALWGYMEYSRQEDSLPIIFDVEGEHCDTHLSLLRKNCTRSELLGILGMIQKDNTSRFNIQYTKEPVFLEKLEAIQKGADAEICIVLTKKESAQFHIKAA